MMMNQHVDQSLITKIVYLLKKNRVSNISVLNKSLLIFYQTVRKQKY